MPIDARIALGAQPAQIDDPLTVRTKQLQLQDLMANQQARQLQYQGAQDAFQRQQQLRSLMGGLPQGATDDQRISALRGGAYFNEADALEKSILERSKTRSEVAGKDFDLLKKRIDATNAVISSVLTSDQEPSHDAVFGAISRAARQYQIPPDQQQAMMMAVPMDRSKIRGWLLGIGSEALSAKERLEALTPKYDKVNTGQQTQFIDTNPVTNPRPAPVQMQAEAKDGWIIGPNGPVMAPGVLAAKQAIAKAGKTDVNLNVNTAKNLTGTIAEGLGKNLDASLSGAQAAVNTISTAEQIRKLANSGQVISGPLADKRIILSRLGQALGVTGKDTDETLANTAALVQNLSKLELDAAQSMKGQGQITEAERAILRRAASGDISMTPPELTALAGALDKTARARIRNHKDQVKRLGAVEGAGPVLPFYNIEEPAAAPAAGAFSDPGKEARYQEWLKRQK